MRRLPSAIQVRHDAYVARRHAEIGLQLTAKADARAQLQQAESRRNELRLQARTVEAERGAREAELSRSVADAALDEAARLALTLKEMEAEQMNTTATCPRIALALSPTHFPNAVCCVIDCGPRVWVRPILLRPMALQQAGNKTGASK